MDGILRRAFFGVSERDLKKNERISCHCIFLFLVKAGADPSQGNPLHWDWAPLHWATLADNLELVQVNRVQHTFIQVLADLAVCNRVQDRDSGNLWDVI